MAHNKCLLNMSCYYHYFIHMSVDSPLKSLAQIQSCYSEIRSLRYVPTERKLCLSIKVSTLLYKRDFKKLVNDYCLWERVWRLHGSGKRFSLFIFCLLLMFVLFNHTCTLFLLKMSASVIWVVCSWDMAFFFIILWHIWSISKLKNKICYWEAHCARIF